MSFENPLWGAPHIHGELLKLGFDVAQSTVSKYMVPRRGRPSQTWKTFLHNHADGIASIDLFVVPTIAFEQLFAFLVLGHGRRQLLWFAVTHDPSLGIKRPKTQEIRSWTEAEIATFENHWLIGTKQRLAFALQLYTGQRRSDVHRMTWTDVNGESIRVVQQKTGRKLAISLHHRLLTILAATERKHVTIINTEYGKPYTVAGFSQWMRDAITAAGLPLECQPHGLRKAAGRRLAEAGCCVYRISDSAWTRRTDGISSRPDEGSSQADSSRAGFAL